LVLKITFIIKYSNTVYYLAQNRRLACLLTDRFRTDLLENNWFINGDWKNTFWKEANQTRTVMPKICRA